MAPKAPAGAVAEDRIEHCAVLLRTISMIPLKNLAADLGESEVMERTMHRWQHVVPGLQPPRLADPGERALHDPADLPQAAAVRRPLPRQVVLDAALLKAPLVPRRAVLPVPVQRLRLPSWSAALAANGRDVVHEVHRFERLVAVGPGDAHGERGALAVDQEVPFGAFLGSIRGIFAGEDPPKTARKLWLSTQQCSQSMPFSRPTGWSRACRSFFQTPRRCQYRSRRQHVTPEPQPISWGRISQGMPLRSTKTMPVRQARSSTGGRPRLPGRALCRGRSGAMASQSSSGTSGSAMAVPPKQGLSGWSCKEGAR